MMCPGPYNPDYSTDDNPIPLWMRWIRTSPTLLLEAEERLLKRIRSHLESSFVPIFQGSCHIRTLVARNFRDIEKMNALRTPREESNVPLVMVHGFASGSGLWCKNLDSLAAHRPVYVFDLLGFGRSSRPPFSNDPDEAEKQFVDSVEEWRAAMKLEKFILLGHSLGGYIATSYAISHPNRVAHLVLDDPWGFFGLPSEGKWIPKDNRKTWLPASLTKALINTNPLSVLRGVGPIGRKLIHHVRQDLRFMYDQRNPLVGESFEVPSENDEFSLKTGAFHGHTTDSEQPLDTSCQSIDPRPVHANDIKDCERLKLDPVDLDGSVALDYVYHINVQRPSGEIGFKSMCSCVAFAYRPMLLRIGELDPHIPITFIYGSRSWIDMSSGVKTRAARPGSYVDIKIIEGAGHQVHAEAAEEFNAYVNAVCEQVDRGTACNPVPVGEHERRYAELNSKCTIPPTDQRFHRVNPSSSAQKIVSSRCDGLDRSSAVVGSLGHEASDEASD
ncbi:Abhydrolase domain-containing protein 4 [Fasciola hepatica]|uniref:Abhydrolase domain-containing protein 4 n=1 Tax=Fasciola hepatica TaxID=6192 RepID=A0A4E0REY8_FASHE|nr:Abhydrolase domain-containing protein 4 [Fasciola hepatica]